MRVCMYGFVYTVGLYTVALKIFLLLFSTRCERQESDLMSLSNRCGCVCVCVCVCVCIRGCVAEQRCWARCCRAAHVHIAHVYMDTHNYILHVHTLTYLPPFLWRGSDGASCFILIFFLLTASLLWRGGQHCWARCFQATLRLTVQRARTPSPSASSSGY